jgi:hypothetical protein
VWDTLLNEMWMGEEGRRSGRGDPRPIKEVNSNFTWEMGDVFLNECVS